MKLSCIRDDLFAPGEARIISAPEGADDAEVLRVERDSRGVRSGDLFACIPGTKHDGHDFAREAVRGGASALLVERPLGTSVPELLVPRSRSALGRIAAGLTGRPSDRMTMVAVTGTNGKTTSSYMIRSVLARDGRRTGLLGTIVYDEGRGEVEADRTTPEGDELQAHLAAMVGNGCSACVMEASSHGLEQGRLEGCRFDCGAFSNLTPEHLDYHGDMERYFAAKERLFLGLMKDGWVGTTNVDDPYGARLAERFPDRMYPFSLSGRRGALAAAISRESLAGMDLEIRYPDGERAEVRIPTLGRYNAENALLALAAAESLRIPRDTALTGLAAMPPVPGRMERYLLGHGVGCIIDYAHSPDGLDKVLSALRGACSGRLWAVFGHGGERYALSRPALGRIAAERADRVVITMDNPRSEDPAQIAGQIRGGVTASGRGTPCEVVLDRGEAIRFALDRALPGDLVAVTGKGPEKFILFGDRKIPFQDRQVLLDWAAAHGVDVA